ncbi:fungal-specific transcription factor [Plectosphaerella plurivora]|uniref:Fungal-specific transcription factor n=1 Tax=Plectosphaerella plurivora TaxID=936078 RepID=A0A9P8VKP1_9PEZI|nr:fungal-specific transcription factor [Plectosphaerella plurivora]
MSTRNSKKLSFSCDTCRRRKVKCGGEQPKCHRCISRGDSCVYTQNPTLTYTSRLENRIKQLEAELAAARGQRPPTAIDGFNQTPSPASFGQSSQSPADAAARHLDADDDAPGTAGETLKGVKVDGKGGITYHGITSFFQLPSDGQASPRDAAASSSEQTVQRRERLVANAWQQRVLENYSDIPEPFQYLLNVHWCWIQPLFNFIYRPAFTRDLQSLGPYYSHTLMNAILSHSIRWGRSDPAVKEQLDASYDGGALFGKHARRMALEELTSGSCAIPVTCSVPTVQALLLLSAQECSVGNSAQAWIYSGIAFRIIDHLGICVDGDRYAGTARLTDEDVEIRHRLFWSCFLWDKVVSLYLGRSPTLKYSAVSPPRIILDDSSETEPWVPFGVDNSKYPPTAAHSTSCFMQACQLSLILNEILIHMYDPVRTHSKAELRDCVDKQAPVLRQWWDNLPGHLRIDVANLPALAPPSHIVTLNILYHTFKILLYRPMLSHSATISEGNLQPMQGYLIECITSATSIISIFDLFCRTFGIRYCVLSISYSVYIATSIFLLQVQSNPEDSQAMRRLEYCVRTLAQVQRINPVISSALELITQQLRSLSIQVPGLEPFLPDGPPPMQSYGIPDSRQPQDASAIPPGPESAFTPEMLHLPFGDQFNPEDYNIDPMRFETMFETLSSLEPLSARVAAIDGLGPERP